MSKLALILLTASAFAGEWSDPVHVLHDMQPCVTYRARTDGDFLVIEAKLQPGWHTFTIDNEKRAEEKRAGKPSLGIDQPTRFTLTGLELAGPWYQSEPKDFSKPKMRWYSWGFEQQVTFAAKVRRPGSGPATIGVRGQACTDSTCKNIDVSIPVPASDESGKTTSVDLKTLVQVR